VKLHPVGECVVGDRAGMGSTLAQGFPIPFPGSADVGGRDGGKGHQFHGVHFDLYPDQRVLAALPHLGPASQPEGYGDFTRYHVFAQLPAKFH